MDRADGLVLAGVVAVGLGLYYGAGWPAVLCWAGLMLMAMGVAQARGVKR